MNIIYLFFYFISALDYYLFINDNFFFSEAFYKMNNDYDDDSLDIQELKNKKNFN